MSFLKTNFAAFARYRARRCRPRVWLLMLGAWFGFAALAMGAGEEFLEPEEAFALSARAVDESTVELMFTVAPGYYLYRDAFQFTADTAVLGPVEVPKGKIKFDETFGKNIETHRGDVRVRLPVLQAGAMFKLNVVSQGCADAGLCYPPLTRTADVSLGAYGGSGHVRFVMAEGSPSSSGVLASAKVATTGLVDNTTATESDIGDAYRVLHTGRFWVVVGAFWVMGLLLSLTPCVLPMLPILSSIIIGSGPAPSRARGLMLAASYSSGMALVYTALGIAAGMAGEGLAARLQSPWVLGSFAAALVVFALSTFGVIQLRLPAPWQAPVVQGSRRLPAGRVVGVCAMGAVSALIVSPCVTAPLAGTLLFLSQTRDVVLGGAALFAMAVGMSVPLMLLGVSAGAWIPKAGHWMRVVQRFFGVALLALAIWTLLPLLPSTIAMLLSGALLLLVGCLLRPWLASGDASPPSLWLQRGLGCVAMVLGLAQWVGAATGGHDVLRPLAQWSRGAEAGTAAPPNFRRVLSVAELDALLSSTDRPVLLNVFADWCVSCKEMELLTFSSTPVAKAMSGALLLKADVTANSQDDRELLRRFKLFGPPGIVFFGRDGQELRGLRVVGFQDATRFEKTLHTAGL